MRNLTHKAISKTDKSIVRGYAYKWQDRTYMVCGIINCEPYVIEVLPESICAYICTDKTGTDIYENDISQINGKRYKACYNNMFNKYEWRELGNDNNTIDILSDCIYNIVV